MGGQSPRPSWVSLACGPGRRCALMAEQGEARLERPVEATAGQLAKITCPKQQRAPAICLLQFDTGQSFRYTGKKSPLLTR